MSDSYPQREDCCPQCPFARSTPKEYLDTRGQNGERFAGQSVGAFVLPCHMTREFDKWFENYVCDEHVQPLCAGAAKFRANIGVDKDLPEIIGRLPEDHENVFSNHAELLAHHLGTTVEDAEDILSYNTVEDMHRREFIKARAMLKPVPKE